MPDLLRRANWMRWNSMHKALSRLAVIAGVTFLIASIPVLAEASPDQTRAKPSRNLAEPVSAQEMIWWLPADTESVVVARGPFAVPASLSEDSEKNEQTWFTKGASEADIHQALEALPLEVAYDLDDLIRNFDLAKALQGHAVAIAIQGSRHFREPRGGSEVMDFEGSSILVFERDLGGLEGGVGQLLSGKATGTETVDGTRVLMFSQKSGGDEWTYFVAIPRPSVLLVANNRKYFEEVIERMGQRKLPRALPDELPEWRYLDVNARFWGMRHFDPAQAKVDPTSPFGDDEAFGPSDKKAIGLLFEVDPKHERNASIIDFSGDVDGLRKQARAGIVRAEPQEGVSFQVKLRNPAPGVLVQSYTLDKSSTLDYFVLAVMMSLGRGMYF